MSGHARLGPSSASRWLRCPYSIALAEAEDVVDRASGPAAQAGTILHGAFERAGVEGHVGLMADEIAELATLGYGLDWAMPMLFDAITAWRDFCTQEKLIEVQFEQRVPCGVAIGRSDFWGTADVIAWRESDRHLFVLDLKTGKWPVAPQANDQLLSYGLGAREVVGHTPDFVTLGVIQPAAAKAVISWTTEGETLDRFAEFVAERAALTDVLDPATASPGTEQCRFCPARGVCAETF